MKNTKKMEQKVNAIVDEILDEDQENDFSATGSGNCPRDCEEPDTPKEISRQCKCGVENSTRFSLRVLEAMRLLQRDVDQPFTSSVDDIVNYIRANYRHDGDLYAQVRTALRQVCSQGYVMELFNNEYYLVGPVVSAIKPTGCSWDCKGRISTTIDDTSRRRKSLNNHRNGICRCERFLRGNGPPQDARVSRENSLGRTFIVDRDEDSITEPKFHSTRISANERNNADYRDTEFDTEELLPSCDCNDTSDIRNDRRQRDITGIHEIERRDELAEPIPGPSRVRALSPTPVRKAKKTRLKDRIVQRVDENNEETTTEEEMDCTCDTNGVTRVTQDEHSRRRPRVNRTRVVIRNQRNGQRPENDEEKDEEDEERVEEDDEDIEDSAYRELNMRIPRRRNAARERELKRWIRRCRQECERRAR
ncbi:uncharacterized protein [Anoplolepis gracilipes]|uniref:uncharacterized protein n=1 Tax=Anoplolepis gracilipes TaxID=354296 RepID=UPI003B9EA646